MNLKALFAWPLLFCLVLAAAAPGSLAASGPAISLRLAELHPADHPTAQADYEFARLVDERSRGRIRIAVYTDSALGQEISVLEQVQFGAIDIARVSLSAVASYVPRLNALQMPYLYRDADHMWRVLNGEVGRELLASVRDAGFVGLGWFEAGSRNFYNSRRSVTSPADLKGLRIRVQESQLMSDIVTALGARAVQQPFGEVYSALETGAIDGAENNMPTYFSSQHYKVARYYTLTEHARIPEIVVGSALGLASLSPADLELIRKAAMDAVDFQRKAWDGYEKLAAERVRSAGVVIVSKPDLGPWKALARRAYELQSPEIRALVERIRAVK
ncbi:MAG TPA: TRAP transporter substrate-binding protein [Rectinemataceae bacterium]|nr:TRAP transporter substrate-binding protein [Rectinemataceae bacterium]